VRPPEGSRGAMATWQSHPLACFLWLARLHTLPARTKPTMADSKMVAECAKFPGGARLGE
jgi:hypothetical protein